MEALLAALERGRTRLGRPVFMIGAGLTALLSGVVIWQLTHGSRLTCTVPEHRVAAAWAANRTAEPRRQAIHRAFAASGRDSAETSWQRLSKTLDDYMQGWSAMYLETCEATHLRGEQSAELLDLRMSCLADNLDQVRALTDALMTADQTVVSRSVMAAKDLTPVSRCADVALLRSAVPLPRDERTLAEVRRLRPALAEVQTMLDLSNFGAVLRKATALRPQIEATGYKPLLAELLNLLGMAEVSLYDDVSKAEATLRAGMIAAEASRDDQTAAKIAASMIFVVGYRLGRVEEAEFWAGLANAILDRVPGDQTRLRAWVATNHAAVRARIGDFEGARVLVEKSVQLKENSLGKEHPDLGISLGDLAATLTLAGHHAEALAAANRALEIFHKYNDPDSYGLGFTYSNQGAALNGLGRYAEAEDAFTKALQILSKSVGAAHPETASALHGLGEIRVARGIPVAAVPLFERALEIRRQPHADPTTVAESEFGLARALWDSGRDRAKARVLATAALKTYQGGKRSERQRAVETWLAAHRGR
jgi:tetratricopeptide (TPR) repeat protein